jgi:hypothetical protein
LRRKPGVGRTAVALAAVALAGGCSYGDGTGTDGQSAGPSATPADDERATAQAASGSPAPPRGAGGASPVPSGSAKPPDPERLPRTYHEALVLARAVAAQPDVYGGEFVRQRSYESAPRTVPVLDKSCRWQREPLPDEVLAGLSRASERPGDGSGKGPLRATAHVTVYRTAKSADAAMATFLEDALRCPDQRPRPGERVTSLASIGEKPTLHDAEDSVFEVGDFTSAEHGGPHPYVWAANRLGPVVFAVSVKGAGGHGEQAVQETGAKALSSMLTDVRRELR